jgi:hypothetical protein
MFRNKKINKLNLFIVSLITGINLVGFIFGKYDLVIFLRSMFSFILPLYIFVINSENINVEYVFSRCLRLFNLLIYCSFIISLIQVITKSEMFLIEKRTGGILGHPLTAGWYYVIFIAMNFLYCKYYKGKNDIFIIKDMFICILGITFTTGRVSLVVGLLLNLVYIFVCLKSKIIKYVIIPVIIIGFMFSPIVNELIWEKFRVTILNGDITNGRMWALREMEFFNIYPNFMIGNGIGYSNYVSQYLLGTFNFENPLIMFTFDYGVFTVIILIIFTFIKPCINMIISKYFALSICLFSCYAIPYTYNGLAESTGLFMVLIFVTYFFTLVENDQKNKYYI